MIADIFECPTEVKSKFGTCDLTEAQFKLVQEGAFENTIGTTATDFLMLMSVMFLGFLAGEVILPKTNSIGTFVIYFIISIMPHVLEMSVPELLPHLLGFTVCLYLFSGKWKSPFTNPGLENGHHPIFLSCLRAHIAVATNVAILAVDFFAFPREYSKSTALPGVNSPAAFAAGEVTGYSLMDQGISALVFVMGMVSLPARGGDVGSLWANLKTTGPTVIIGASRLVVLSILDVHVPMTEYGRHWNFFFSLVVVSILGWAGAKALGGKWLWVAGLVMLPLAPLAFSMGMVAEGSTPATLNAWGLNPDLAPEPASYSVLDPTYWMWLLGANKYGLSNAITMTSIFCVGVSVGHAYLTKAKKAQAAYKAIKEEKAAPTPKGWGWESLFLLALGFGCYYLARFGPGAVEITPPSPENSGSWAEYLVKLAAWVWFGPPSRQAGNLSWFLLGISTCSIIVGGVCFFFETKSVPCSSTFSRGMTANQLPIFLLANLLTGLCGRGIRSLVQPRWVAVAVLTGYCVVWASIAFFLGMKNKKIKLL